MSDDNKKDSIPAAKYPHGDLRLREIVERMPGGEAFNALIFRVYEGYLIVDDGRSGYTVLDALGGPHYADGWAEAVDMVDGWIAPKWQVVYEAPGSPGAGRQVLLVTPNKEEAVVLIETLREGAKSIGNFKSDDYKAEPGTEPLLDGFWYKNGSGVKSEVLLRYSWGVFLRKEDGG